MAFFDDLGKKLTDVSQNALQKTKDLTDTAKYTAAISECEKKIKTQYAILGEIYYNQMKDSATGDLLAPVEEITKIKLEIEDYKKKIEELKNVNKCPNCGAPVSESDAFCAACGSRIEKPVAVATAPVCSNCGKPLQPGSVFCIYCGTKAVQDETTASNADAAPECLAADAKDTVELNDSKDNTNPASVEGE